MPQTSLRSRPLVTNGFVVETPEIIDFVVRDMPDPGELKAERERLRGFWFVHWVGGKLYHLRLKAGGPNVDGEQRPAPVLKYTWLVRARVDDVIGVALPQYEPIRVRPFTFLAQRAELIQPAAEAARITHPLINEFTVTPRFEVTAKTFEPVDRQSKVGVFVTVEMQFDIAASLSALRDADVDLGGLHVVRRTPEPGKRRLVGRIARVEGNITYLSEGTEGQSIETDRIKLEGSKESVARCLTTLLGLARYQALMRALDDEQANYLVGPDFDAVVTKLGTHLAKTKLPIALGFDAKIGDRIVLTNSDTVQTVYVAPQVDYVFDRTGAQSNAFAWPGLSQFGPFDRTTFANKSPRLLVVFPTSTQGKVEAFLRAFRDGLGANHRGFARGFRDVFGLVNLEFVMCPVQVGVSDRQNSEPAYRNAIEERLSAGEEVQGAIVVLFEEHAHLKGLQNPYLRTKALLLTLGIPTQEVRMTTVNQMPGSLQYTLQNFAVSVYAKLNGTPWTVNQDKAISDELVVGMGFAEFSGSRFEDRQRFVGITTVFSGDGTYLLGNVSKECNYADYPKMVRDSMLSVLRELKTRNNWRPGDTVRVIFHAHRPLKRVDVGKIVFACVREIGAEQVLQMAFVTVSHDHPFYIMDRAEKGEPVKRESNIMKGEFAPLRGTIARIGPSTRLLATNSHKLIKRANSPLPAPLLIGLHPDSTFKDVDYIAEQALKFTSLSWRSTLPARTPVTIFYSERIAELLGRLKDVPDFSTTALSVKLKWSRWFL
ncbi:Piwi domain-containing protein [Bradyrhizobium sp. CCGUVB4N]|uniref:argonaute/piwi family protein n=1 Tax=Bradyrhizobium sp. CCGUVB4N TaxID=2949631 RepID=UPI0020B212E2|nr:Piwi domain-containing protein [Bradyrhizobium sp. CCGUVB4N]MCP3385990.1 Piwi domain-containing protein [Bradyrhizobium sp. CCGUVB4N]